MDNYWESIFSYSAVPPDHPFLRNASTDVFIMGERYSSHKDNDAIYERLYSLYWMTYRKCFSPIGCSSGPTSDTGWGCMHRCSQMMMAEAIIRVKLGADWRWKPGCSDDDYLKLRALFQDCNTALYSIQNITQTGVSVGKPIASWFGPNTAVQVIKKLTADDLWINWAVHITVEDGVIVDEIKSLCRGKYHAIGSPLKSNTFKDRNPFENVEKRGRLEANSKYFEVAQEHECPPPVTCEFEQLPSSTVRTTVTAFAPGVVPCDDSAEMIIVAPVMHDIEEDFLEVVIPPSIVQQAFADGKVDQEGNLGLLKKQKTHDDMDESVTSHRVSVDGYDKTVSWRPLLLFIPLRLGLQTANPCYFEAIKKSLRITQSIGILGGRPGHAFWIVGLVGQDEVLCLDPHEVQPASTEAMTTPDDDASHHCARPSLSPLTKLDPSLVLGFVCPTEHDFDLLCEAFSQHLLSPETSCGRPLFELHQRRPYYLPPFPTATTNSTSHSPENPCQQGGWFTVGPLEEASVGNTELDHGLVCNAEAESGASQPLVSSLRLAGSHLASGLSRLTPNAVTLKSLYRRVVADVADTSNNGTPPVPSDKLSS